MIWLIVRRGMGTAARCGGDPSSSITAGSEGKNVDSLLLVAVSRQTLSLLLIFRYFAACQILASSMLVYIRRSCVRSLVYHRFAYGEGQPLMSVCGLHRSRSSNYPGGGGLG
jgi:hypothetical protein